MDCFKILFRVNQIIAGICEYTRGKSGLHRAGCQLTAGGGDSKESATEIYRLLF